MRLILISGKAGSGKDEVASLLKVKLPATAITSFSKYIKLFARELTEWDGSDNNKPREFLQLMGDKLRAVDEDYLTKRIKEDIKVYEMVGIKNVIVSDVRLVHEMEYYDNIEDIEVIKIRVNASRSKRKLTDKEKLHHTELELDNYNGFDYVIENNFDESLENEVIKIVEGMK